MLRKCAWCGKTLGSVDVEPTVEGAPITHGICPNCARGLLSEMAKPLTDFLDQFPDPVFVVSTEGRIKTGNSAGLSMLGKKKEDVDGKLGGEAFGCRYANTPGGCGKSTHCRSCTIRNTVSDTMKTGRCNEQVAAYPDLHFLTEESKVRFLITTEKVGESVLLRIDDVAAEEV